MKKLLAVLSFFLIGCGGSSSDSNDLSSLPDFPMPIGTAGAGFYNNELYVFGGSINYDGDSNYSSIYKLSGSTWTQVDTMMNDATWDGKLLISGSDAYYVSGWSGVNSSLQKYNFVTKLWTPLPAGHISQNWGMTAQLLNNKIYLFAATGQVDIYDIGLNNWTLADTNTLAQNNFRALTSVEYLGNIYITGYGDSSLYKYDIAANEFTIESAMPRSICGSAMAQINGKIYLIGGSSDWRPANVYSDSYVYDLIEKTWTSVSLDPVTPVIYPAVVLSGNSFYLIGGFDFNYEGTSDAYSFSLN